MLDELSGTCLELEQGPGLLASEPSQLGMPMPTLHSKRSHYDRVKDTPWGTGVSGCLPGPV